MPFFQAKVPVTVATGIICLLVGGGVGAAIVSYAAGGKPDQAQAAPADDEGGKGPEAKGGKGGPGGGKGGPPGGAKGGAPKGPNPKVQLTQLVGKLDVLTRESLHVELTADQKKQVKELLAGLEEKEAITDEEAKAKFDALLKLLEGNKKTLEDAGYRWPGGGGGGMGGPGGGGGPQVPPNPFKAGDAATHLKTLQATVSK
jgi:hypothetical protein